MKFRRKPVVVEAFRLGEDYPPDWWMQKIADRTVNPLDGGNGCTIKTLEGVMTALSGEWIIKGVKGEIYPCKPDIFAEFYESVE